MFERGIYIDGISLAAWKKRNEEIVAENRELKIKLEFANASKDIADDSAANLRDMISNLQKDLLIARSSEMLAWSEVARLKRNPNILHINTRG